MGMTMNSPDRLLMYFERNSVGFDMDLAMSSPDKFPINFERHSLRFPYGKWPRAIQTNFPIDAM